jgi:hypothetical protein
LVPERASRPTMCEVVQMLQAIRGSNLQPESFYVENGVTMEESPTVASLPFANLSSIFHSVNWVEHSQPNSDHNHYRDSFEPI